MKLRLLALGCLLVGPSRWAAAVPPMPQGCRTLATAVPGPGATIPANTPALFFSPPEHASGGSWSVEGMELQLRQPGLPDPVPFVLQAANEFDPIASVWPNSSSNRIVRIERPLQVGEAILSFIDDGA